MASGPLLPVDRPQDGGDPGRFMDADQNAPPAVPPATPSPAAPPVPAAIPPPAQQPPPTLPSQHQHQHPQQQHQHHHPQQHPQPQPQHPNRS